jgi:transposase
LAHQLPGRGWTLKKLKRYVAEKLGQSVSRSTLRQLLKQAGLSWKKCRKLLTKADPRQRAAFIEQFQALFERMCRQELVLVYVDEAHLHQDLDLGYTWAPTGQPAWRVSTSPGLVKRINWYGAYDFSQGRCFIWNEGRCNGEHTLKFLQRLVQWLDQPDRHLVIIWDGASYHRSKIVRAEAQRLGIELIALPSYSPDLNPIEGLWKWLRAEVTQHYCHLTMAELFFACKKFIDTINQDPDQIITRLWPKFDLDPDYEKLLVSN